MQGDLSSLGRQLASWIAVTSTNQPKDTVTPRHFDQEFQRSELWQVRRMERSAWLEQQLTDAQRMERARLEVKMRNGQLRDLPSAFLPLEDE